MVNMEKVVISNDPVKFNIYRDPLRQLVTRAVKQKSHSSRTNWAKKIALLWAKNEFKKNITKIKINLKLKHEYVKFKDKTEHLYVKHIFLEFIPEMCINRIYTWNVQIKGNVTCIVGSKNSNLFLRLWESFKMLHHRTLLFSPL